MPRPRKRVHGIRRGPDGSAFQNCESCGLCVAIALADMHECENKRNVCKKLKGRCENEKVMEQPRSAFLFFMEEFSKTCKDGSEVEIDKKGCATWKNMSKAERQPFVLRADKLNSAYVKMLQKEESEIQWVDDEADSIEVGKYDKMYDHCDNYDVRYFSQSSFGSGLFLSESNWSFISENSFRSSSTQKAR